MSNGLTGVLPPNGMLELISETNAGHETLSAGATNWARVATELEGSLEYALRERLDAGDAARLAKQIIGEMNDAAGALNRASQAMLALADTARRVRSQALSAARPSGTFRADA